MGDGGSSCRDLCSGRCRRSLEPSALNRGCSGVAGGRTTLSVCRGDVSGVQDEPCSSLVPLSGELMVFVAERL